MFSREFKLEAVNLVRARGVSVAQASRDLGIHANVLRKWVRDATLDPVQAFSSAPVIGQEMGTLTALQGEIPVPQGWGNRRSNGLPPCRSQ